ncbi:MAG: FecR family protein [Candidatus Shapirobacteria bacterium]|jgi:hypothetical protein
MVKIPIFLSSLICLLCFLFSTTSSFASFPFDTEKFLPPPTTVNVQFGRLDLDKYYVVSVSGIWDAISNKLDLNISDSGTFSKTVTVDNKRHSADKFIGGVTPEDGVFTLSGTYKKGHISGQWSYELSIPPREGWKYPESYVGSGTFYTTQPISESSGAGIIEGSLTLNKTNWKDKKMVDHVAFTQTDNFSNSWTAVSNCQEVICGCFEYDDPVDSRARFNSLTGEVSLAHCYKDGKSQDWTPATPKAKLLVNDHILTGADSFAVLQFEDMTTFRIKSSTEVIVKTPPEQETKLGLVSGHLWINFKKMLTNGTMEVEMGQAVAGIKGTTLVLEQVKGASSIKVIEGVVTFKSKQTNQTVDVNAGEKISADFNGLSAIEKFDIAAENAGWGKIDDVKSINNTSRSISPTVVVAAILLLGFFGFLILKKKKQNFSP